MSELSLRVKTAIILILFYGVSIYFGGLLFTLIILVSLLIFLLELKNIVDFKKNKSLFFFVVLIICFATYSLHNVRNFDIRYLIFIISVVVFTDVLGYFFGKLIGGPKVAPYISPKKTWSGIVSGWFGALTVGWVAFHFFHFPKVFIMTAFFLSVFSQFGDFFESYLKRRSGVKDSSNILPGHGGFLDRFDGLIGASFFYGLVSFWIS
jgi:phosphatidate cytidylyltransferase